jgi:hypothetical protein
VFVVEQNYEQLIAIHISKTPSINDSRVCGFCCPAINPLLRHLLALSTQRISFFIYIWISEEQWSLLLSWNDVTDHNMIFISDERQKNTRKSSNISHFSFILEIWYVYNFRTNLTTFFKVNHWKQIQWLVWKKVIGLVQQSFLFILTSF